MNSQSSSRLGLNSANNNFETYRHKLSTGVTTPKINSLEHLNKKSKPGAKKNVLNSNKHIQLNNVDEKAIV